MFTPVGTLEAPITAVTSLPAILNAALPLVSINTHGFEFDDEALLLIFLLTIGAVAAAMIDIISSTIIISINENPVRFTFSSFLFLF